MKADQFEIDLGKKLEALRKAKGKTQEEVAKELGLNSRETVKQWETWDRHIKAKDLIKLSRYYGKSVDYLLGISPVETPDPDLRKVCEYTGLSEKAILNICAYSKHDNTKAVISTLNSFLCSSAGYDFLLALWFVGDISRTIDKCLKALSLQQDDSGNNTVRFLQEMEMDLYGSLYRLSDSAASIATEVYSTGFLKKALNDRLRRAEEEEFTKRNDMLLEADNGEHQEN